MKKTFLVPFIIIGAMFGVGACSGNPSGALAKECSGGLSTAYSELEAAKVNGFGGTVNITKAGSLLAAAKIQYEFEKYPNCIDKVNRARVYIKEAQAK
ncbi:MAG: hypothetical protein AAF530_02555 [Pseudomonadota bacterium]